MKLACGAKETSFLSRLQGCLARTYNVLYYFFHLSMRTVYEAVSPWIVSVRVKTRTDLRNIFQVYAPDSSYPDEQYQDFLDLLQLKDYTFREISTQKWMKTNILPGQKLLESLEWTVRMTDDNKCCSSWPTQCFKMPTLGERRGFEQMEEP